VVNVAINAVTLVLNGRVTMMSVPSITPFVLLIAYVVITAEPAGDVVALLLDEFPPLQALSATEISKIIHKAYKPFSLYSADFIFSSNIKIMIK
jgi:hypothetical protein